MEEFGAIFAKKKYFPLKLISNEMPLESTINGASTQLKSAVIFAGLNHMEKTSVLEIEKSRSHRKYAFSNHKTLK